MIRGFESVHPLEPKDQGHLQWPAALEAGIIAGAVLLIVPRGSPWSALTFFSPVIMGRALRNVAAMPLVMVWVIHLIISIIYGLIISRIASRLLRSRAVLMGGITGVGLYLLNLLIVSFACPHLRGNELSVLFTHIVFGLLAAGIYRGLLKRKALPGQPAQ
jgi:hypothetical protein